jgi:hypothetical protein
MNGLLCDRLRATGLPRRIGRRRHCLSGRRCMLRLLSLLPVLLLLLLVLLVIRLKQRNQLAQLPANAQQ